jgi:Na+-driven multidrug efflux pump
MQASGVISCRTDELLLSDKCSRESRDAAVGFSGLTRPAVEGCQHKEADRQPGGQVADLDPRTRMLLEKPIASMIMRLAIPNATVMTVQVLIGLLEVYFVSRLGVNALAGVAPVFPLISLMLAIAQGAIGGGIVTTVARTLGTGRTGAASEYAWYALALAIPLGLATTAAMYASGPSLYGYMGISGNALAIARSYSSTIFAGATLIWTFNLLMTVVRGTGNLQVPVIVVCSGALILLPLSPALIFGAFGYAGLGPSGGAVAMLVYYAFGTVAYAVYLWGRYGVLKPSFRVPKLSLGPALAILRIGGMSAVVSASTNLTLAIVTAYVGMGGIEALAGYGAGSRLEFLLVPLAYGIGGPVGIVISANLGAGLLIGLGSRRRSAS